MHLFWAAPFFLNTHLCFHRHHGTAEHFSIFLSAECKSMCQVHRSLPSQNWFIDAIQETKHLFLRFKISKVSDCKKFTSQSIDAISRIGEPVQETLLLVDHFVGSGRFLNKPSDSQDKIVCVWSFPDGELLGSYKGHNGAAFLAGFDCHGPLATCGWVSIAILTGNMMINHQSVVVEKTVLQEG